jgi:hypothetical protein
MEAEFCHADKHDEDNNRFSQFLENAWKIDNCLVYQKLVISLQTKFTPGRDSCQ